MKIYLSGPMTGMPDENRPAFMRAARKLRDAGFTVTNPADLPEGWTWDEYMARAMMDLAKCEGVALMPGSWHSKGARREIALALLTEKHIASVSDWCANETWAKE